VEVRGHPAYCHREKDKQQAKLSWWMAPALSLFAASESGTGSLPRDPSEQLHLSRRWRGIGRLVTMRRKEHRFLPALNEG
jgi:hypothetical protein